MTIPDDCPPPPPRLKSSRVEALRAAAKVHEGTINASSGIERTSVLNTARQFEAWLLGEDS